MGRARGPSGADTVQAEGHRHAVGRVNYGRRYERMVAARHLDRSDLVDAYANVPDLVLVIDGLQPEKGHEALDVVRELNAPRVWFAVPLLSSTAAEVEALFVRARDLATALGKPVRAWVSDK
mgnify:CR=1 FL=1